MTVYVTADSTFDFHNWDACWKWTGQRNAVFKAAFDSEGFSVFLDVAGGTGFCTETGCAKAFPDRIREYRESCGARGLPKTFDCVLVVGGYNDVNRRKRFAEDVFRAGVQDMLQECLYLLSATPCDAPAESCVVAGASESASRASLGISGVQTGESCLC